MTSTLSLRIRWLGVALCLGWLASTGQAQMLGGGELHRAFAPGAYVPYDGQSYATRYNYETGPVFYFTGDARQLYLMDYLDRLDRAERFGYPIPKPPRALTEPTAPGQRRWRLGVGFFSR